MEFEEFEQLVLRLLFETEFPVTAAHVAYLGRISIRLSERHLARMVEQGTLMVRTADTGDVIEYYHPGPEAAGTQAGATMAWTSPHLHR